MRHETEIRPVARLQEKRHPGNKPKHGIPIMRVRGPDRDQKHARHERKDVNQVLFPPHVRAPVDEIREDAPEGSEDDVQEAEHGGPVAAAALLEGGEVLQVVGAQDAVDGELGAEGAEVASPRHERLHREDDFQEFLARGFDDDFAAGGVEHLLFADLGFVRESCRLFGLGGFEAELFLGTTVRATAARGGLFVG